MDDHCRCVDFVQVLSTPAEDGKPATSFTLHVAAGSFTDAEIVGMIGQNGTANSRLRLLPR